MSHTLWQSIILASLDQAEGDRKLVNLIFDDDPDSVLVVLLDEGLHSRAGALDAQQVKLALVFSPGEILTHQLFHGRARRELLLVEDRLEQIRLEVDGLFLAGPLDPLPEEKDLCRIGHFVEEVISERPRCNLQKKSDIVEYSLNQWSR